ncbi:MAG: helix-turn-helix domain-containing protein [Deltaproteobacteria bacterium]|jgi:excisionase family DNA binding protein|nr:helix-turn-helix domain-containing protein [Deltaproteobacteria bacterium]MCL5880743.1 helix-turn-helix domain-containing protein [Deltaproteobacteria bacterium]
MIEKLLKIKDVAELINLNENTIYQLIYRRKIPFVKLGRSVRFKESQILAWINKNSCDNITVRK